MINNCNCNPNPSFLHILSQEWLYRGEGNANLVLSLPNIRRIVRLKKTERPKTLFEFLIEWMAQFISWNNKQDSNNERDLKFYTEVIIPLIGCTFVSPVIPALIPKKDIQELNTLLKPLRPDGRKGKTIQNGRASLFIDYAFLPKEWDMILIGSTFAIEIKPKQGWVPHPDRQFNKCPFCLNQYVKLRNNNIKEISNYCPLDLFSGDKNRIMFALKCLIKNPQNNLKIFKDGEYFYGDNMPFENFSAMLDELFEETRTEREIDLFVEMLYKMLIKTYKNPEDCQNCDISNYLTDILNNHETNEECRIPWSCKFSDSYLPKFCILERILTLQKIDVVGLKNNFVLYEYLNTKKTLDNWNYIDKICKIIGTDKSKCPKCILVEYEKTLIKTVDKKEFDCLNDLYLIPYIIASIANDCSFMMTFRKIKDDQESDGVIPVGNIFVHNKIKYALNVGIFDLFPKPLSTIPKHKIRNERRCRAYNLAITSK